MSVFFKNTLGSISKKKVKINDILKKQKKYIDFLAETTQRARNFKKVQAKKNQT